MFLRLLFRENYCPETVTTARFIFLHRQDMMNILSTCRLLKLIYGMPSAARA